MSVAFSLESPPHTFGLVSVAELEGPNETLPLLWPEFEGVLPDRGLPRGVVELASPRALGGGTRVALAAVRGGQQRGPGAWCAWLDPDGSLYAPGVAKADVDLQRLLVVRPPRKSLAEVAVKLVASSAFEVVVVDFAPTALVRPARALGTTASAQRAPRTSRKPRTLRPEVLVRKLALFAGERGSTVILLTDSAEPRPLPWPVSLRLELTRRPGALTVKVAKERACRLTTSQVPWRDLVEGALAESFEALPVDAGLADVG